jgi:hypothetical protein
MNPRIFSRALAAPLIGQRRRLLVVVGVTLLSLATLLLLLWSSQRESRALRELPDIERLQLFERTRQTLLEICDPNERPDGLARFCDQQSDLIVKLPECDASCQDLANRTRSLPRR